MGKTTKVLYLLRMSRQTSWFFLCRANISLRMERILKKLLMLAVVLLLLPVFSTQAHFGAIIPSDDIVTQADSRVLRLKLMFFHPMENQYLHMEKPSRFTLTSRGRVMDLLDTLEMKRIKGIKAWATQYVIKKPGDYVFSMTPKPYWEEAEDCFIVHYTKVVVNALGMSGEWDKPLGLETEIVPLTRPYGLWTNNVFTGQVLLNGKPVSNCEVEVEYFNQDEAIKPPSDPYITQVIKTDNNGIFTYAMPRSGWWGFAALHTAERKMKKFGADKDIEIGAVIWVRTRDMK